MAKVWIDVGAYHGAWSLPSARANKKLNVYAFEPLPGAFEVLRHTSTGLLNYHPVQAAITEHDGTTKFFANAYEMGSSVLPIDHQERERWQGGFALATETRIEVECWRLDTFMEHVGIERVDYLKVDAQGHDLAVVRSLGERIVDVDMVVLEVSLGIQLYQGSNTRDEAMSFMLANGFRYAGGTKQSYDQEENMIFERLV